MIGGTIDKGDDCPFDSPDYFAVADARREQQTIRRELDDMRRFAPLLFVVFLYPGMFIADADGNDSNGHGPVLPFRLRRG